MHVMIEYVNTLVAPDWLCRARYTDLVNLLVDVPWSDVAPNFTLAAFISMAGEAGVLTMFKACKPQSAKVNRQNPPSPHTPL